MSLPRLLLVTDRAQLRVGRSLLMALTDCREAGATHVLVREHDLVPAARRALVVRLTELGLTVISSHDRLPGAAGVHLGAAQPAGTGWFGRSCHSADEVRRAAAEGAAYATLSPYAGSASKPGYGPPVDRAAFVADLPVYALGGIHPGNASRAIADGASGVAVMGAVMRADEPGDVVRGLLEAIR